MKKAIALGLTVATLLCSGQALALTLTNQVMGYYRIQGLVQNMIWGKDQDPDQLITQRVRLKDTLSVGDYFKIVYFGELDFEWGDGSNQPSNSYAASRNQGGGMDGDTINLETKNLYLQIPVKGTPIVATLGLQGDFDHYDMAMWSSDGAGVTIKAPTKIADTELGWFKMLEGNRGGLSTTSGGKNDATKGDNGAHDTIGSARNEDDADLYFARTTVKPIAGLKVGGDLYYWKNQGSQNIPGINFLPAWLTSYTDLTSTQTITVNRQDLYWVGLNGGYSSPAFGVKGWFLYNWGETNTTIKNTAAPGSTANPTRTDWKTKVSGYAASLLADAKVGGLSGFVRGTYWSKAGDNPKKVKAMYTPFWQVPDSSPFGGDGLMIMWGDGPHAVNGATAGYIPAAQQATNGGYGLTGVTVGATYVPSFDKSLYVKGAAGYFRTLSENGYYGPRDGKNVGTEAAARVGYKFCDGALDISLNGAYAWLGNYWNNTVDGRATIAGARNASNGLAFANRSADNTKGVNPDSPYKVFLEIHASF